MPRSPDLAVTPNANRLTESILEPLLPGMMAGLYLLERGRIEVKPTAQHLMLVGIESAEDFQFHSKGPAGQSVLSDGNIVLLPAGWKGTLQFDTCSLTVRFLFTPAVLEATAAELGIGPGSMELVPQELARDDQIQHLAAAVGHALVSDFPLPQVFAKSIGSAILFRISRRFLNDKATDSPPAGLSKWQLQRATDYIENHLEDGVLVKEVAQVAGLSSAYFGTQFRRSMGTTVHQYVIRRRVERARSLLIEGRSISEAALEAGFTDQSHLARSMRRVLGLLPAHFSRLADRN